MEALVTNVKRRMKRQHLLKRYWPPTCPSRIPMQILGTWYRVNKSLMKWGLPMHRSNIGANTSSTNTDCNTGANTGGNGGAVALHLILCMMILLYDQTFMGLFFGAGLDGET
jgi:hypothetical protein